MVPVSTESPDDFEWIESPLVYDGLAVVIRGDHYSPRYLDGEVLAYHANAGDPEDVLGEEAFVGLVDGRIMLKRIVAGSRRGRYTLLSLNPRGDTMLDVQVVWAAPIDWHHHPRKPR